MAVISLWTVALTVCLLGCASAIKDSDFKIRCRPGREMIVEFVKPESMKSTYLQHLKQFPEKSCQPTISEDKVTFTIDLKNIYTCAVTEVVNKGTGRRVFYHRIIVENHEGPKEAYLVKCDSGDGIKNSTESKIVKRSPRPQFENFEEQEVEITGEVTGRAPVPELLVGVTQNDILIDDELTVKPGTPLEMNIELDRNSADIYGVMVSNMEVTDTRENEEILILNGCTVDPYLFENFRTRDGDRLTAQFKAFKFPESNFVLFKGTVSVCLDRCGGIECANGEVGFGKRRRRDVDDSEGPDLNRIYEVNMATIVKVAEDGEIVEDRKIEIDEIKESAPKVAKVPEAKDLWVEKGTMAETVKLASEDAAIAALSREYSNYKYVEFEADYDEAETRTRRNSSCSLKASFSTLILAMSICKYLWH